MNKKDEWLDYVRKYVLCTVFGYARYSKGMEKITGYEMKNSLTLPSLGWKNLTSLRDESDEPIYIYKDKFMRWFVRQCIKGGRCSSFVLYSKFKIANNAFKATSRELNVKENICEVIEACVEYMCREKKTIEKEYDSSFDDYRKNNEKEEEKYVRNQLSKLPIHIKLGEFILTDVLMDCDATSLSSSAM